MKTETKHLYIIRGLPGSGKTTFADSIVAMAPGDVVRLEADDYFICSNGTYEYDPAKISHAHDECMTKFLGAMHLKKHIIISNTSIKDWEWRDYRNLAEKEGYMVHVLIKENYHDGVSTHGVPLGKIIQMKNNFSVNLYGRKVLDARNYTIKAQKQTTET
jgi:hydroxymethylpyrimidine pyrophosphatase-like HAD family hydrolase